jgi:hypothetical protein
MFEKYGILEFGKFPETLPNHPKISPRKIIELYTEILFSIYFPLQNPWTLHLFFQYFTGVGFYLNGICFFRIEL